MITPPTHTHTPSTPSLSYFGEKRDTRRAGERKKVALLKLQKAITHYPTLRKLSQDHKFEASLGCSWTHLKTKRLIINSVFNTTTLGLKINRKKKNT